MTYCSKELTEKRKIFFTITMNTRKYIWGFITWRSKSKKTGSFSLYFYQNWKIFLLSSTEFQNSRNVTTGVRIGQESSCRQPHCASVYHKLSYNTYFIVLYLQVQFAFYLISSNSYYSVSCSIVSDSLQVHGL